MILQLIQILLTSLGFNETRQKSLYQQPEYRILNPQHPTSLIILSIIAMILFVAAVFLFMPGTESGVVYNNSWI